MKKMILAGLLLICSFAVKTQTVEWIKHFNFPNTPIQLLSDSSHSVYTAGFYGYSSNGYFINRTNASGTTDWQILDASGYGPCGFTKINSTLSLKLSTTLKRFDSFGNPTTSIPLSGSRMSGCYNNLIVQHGYQLVNYDSNDNLKWSEPLDSLSTAEKIVVGNGCLYVMEKFYDSHPHTLVKYDTSGNLIWKKILPGSVTPSDFHTDEDGNCYITGEFRGSANFDGNLIIASKNYPCYPNADWFVAKMNATGSFDWAVTPSDSLILRSVFVHDNLIFVCGRNGGPCSQDKSTYSVYSEAGGTHLGTYLFNFGAGSYELATQILCQDNNIFLAGQIGIGPSRTSYLAKINRNISTGTSVLNNELFLTVYPNPAKDEFAVVFKSHEKANFQMNIFSSQGTIVYSQAIQNFEGRFQKTIDLSKESKGIYFIEIIADRKRSVKKVILK